MAQPRKLTDETQRIICEALAAGNFLTTASAIAGVALSTLHDWLRRGARAAKGDEAFVVFRDAVRESQATAERDLLEVIRTASRGPDGQWTAAAWILERSRPKRWAKRDLNSETAQTIARLERKVKQLTARHAQKAHAA